MKYRVIKDFYPFYDVNGLEQNIKEMYVAECKNDEDENWVKMTDFFISAEKAIEYVDLKSGGEICLYEKEVKS